ncbi:MAG: hypothetical protein ACJ78Q_11550 [Chloroflexia bacterium]
MGTAFRQFLRWRVSNTFVNAMPIVFNIRKSELLRSDLDEYGNLMITRRGTLDRMTRHSRYDCIHEAESSG